MNNPLKTLKLFDYLAFFASLLVLASVVIPFFTQAGGEAVFQVSSPEGEWLYPISATLEFRPAELPGSCLVSIRDRSVRVLESNCPKTICIGMGSASKPGDWIACLPHKVFIRVLGTSGAADEDAVDAVST